MKSLQELGEDEPKLQPPDLTVSLFLTLGVEGSGMVFVKSWEDVRSRQ